jgi:hypothetical protein
MGVAIFGFSPDDISCFVIFGVNAEFWPSRRGPQKIPPPSGEIQIWWQQMVGIAHHLGTSNAHELIYGKRAVLKKAGGAIDLQMRRQRRIKVSIRQNWRILVR